MKEVNSWKFRVLCKILSHGQKSSGREGTSGSELAKKLA